MDEIELDNSITDAMVDAAFYAWMRDTKNDKLAMRRAIRAALSLPESNTGEWQPIETAPKDVDVLLAWESSDGKWEMEVGWAGHENKHKGGYSDGWLHGEATHWQPLPEAPL